MVELCTFLRARWHDGFYLQKRHTPSPAIALPGGRVCLAKNTQNATKNNTNMLSAHVWMRGDIVGRNACTRALALFFANTAHALAHAVVVAKLCAARLHTFFCDYAARPRTFICQNATRPPSPPGRHSQAQASPTKPGQTRPAFPRPGQAPTEPGQTPTRQPSLAQPSLARPNHA